MNAKSRCLIFVLLVVVGTLAEAAGPVITLQPRSQVVSCASDVTLVVTATGTGTLTYQWRYNTSPITGATAASLPLSHVSLSASGNYSVVVTDSTGFTTSNNALLSVVDNSSPSVQCQNITVNLTGTSVSITPAQVVASASDTCGTVSLTATPSTFTCSNIGPNTVSVVANDGNGNTASCSATVTVIDARPVPAAVYVDDGYTGLSSCAPVAFPYSGPGGSHLIGYDAFATIQAAVTAVASGGTIHVAPGAYVEDIQIGKALALVGPNAGKAGSDASRGPEAVLMPATPDPEYGQIIYAGAGSITIDGLLFDGDNPVLTGGYGVAGADVNTSVAIQNTDFWLTPFAQIDRVVIRNNIFKNFSYDAIYHEVDLGSNHSWNYIQSNKFDNMWEGLQTYGPHSIVSDNIFTNVDRGLSLHGTTGPADAGFAPAVLRNQIWIKDPATWMPGRQRVVGIWVNYRRGQAPALVVAENTVTYSYAVPAGKAGYGLWALTVDDGRAVTFRDNVVNGGGYCNIGLLASAIDPAATVLASGGGFNGIKDYGVFAGRYDLQYGDGSARLALTNVTIILSGSGTGIQIEAEAAVSVVGSAISGGSAGIEVNGGAALLERNKLTGNSAAGILVLNSALVDAGDCAGGNFSGLGTGSGANGSSAGGNDLSGYGFDDAAPWAIQNINASVQPPVLAQDNDFGAAAGGNIDALIYDHTDNAANSSVLFSQIPQLLIDLQGGTLIVSWPVTCSIYVPEQRTSLDPAVPWAAASGQLSVVNGQHRLASPNNGTMLYYRLRKL